MTNSFVNIVAPVQLKDVRRLRAEIGSEFGNPANDAMRAAFGVMNGEDGIHFASMHALTGSDAQLGYILLEFTTDGDGDAATNRLAAAATQPLSRIFAYATDWRDGNDLADYLCRHRVRSGFGLFDQAGLDFAGTPGMSVGRIRREAALRRRVEALVAAQPVSRRPIEQIRSIRSELQADEQFKWALDLPEPAALPGKPVEGLARVGRVALAFLTTYCWPLICIVLIGSVLAGFADTGAASFLCAAWAFFWRASLVSIALILAMLGVLYWRLRVAEESDWISDRTISRAELAEILKRENHLTQNHMISHTVLKPGLMRKCISKLAFFAIGTLTALNGRPGFLGLIGTIHFARWMTIPGTRDYIFLSNYDGSWESYLEDFITKAHDGLTAAWSCTMGFPKTRNLFQLGATDGERFKRFARHSMVHTAAWYSAYPDISTDQIRANAHIRRAVAIAESDEEAIAMLSLFGSVVRPSDKLEANQIQSIVFGGLSNLPFGACLLINLSEEQAECRKWLASVKPHIAYSDGRSISDEWVITCSLGPSALRKLGLPRAAIETFPAAFLDTMVAPGRDRILGDVDANGRSDGPNQWWWGHTTPDIALLAYAQDAKGLKAARKALSDAVGAHGHSLVHSIDLEPVPTDAQKRVEPFGFLDGVSQPLIKGTYKATRNPNRVNLVEPGEFILGYPDNRGNLPPVPRMPARRDPLQLLPIGDGGWDFDASLSSDDRDIGRNGSFLVIRQLEQHVTAFEDYCAAAAKDIQQHQRPGYTVEPEYVGAKMVGRWKDGSALVRWPYESESKYLSDTGNARKPKPENDFLYGTEDPQALRCPYGSHIRRTNPRESQLPGSSDQIDISNRHRILRIGRVYQAEKGQDPGILFMCLNGDIERQFEFIQQTWANSGHFHALDGEVDPLIGANGEGSHFTIPTRTGPIRLANLPRFVTTRGGGYFFLPGRKLVDYLASD